MQPNYLGIYAALVTNINDPTLSGRIRVQCPQISAIAEVNWALPVNPQETVPVIGSVVWLGFNGGDLTKPVYFSNTTYLSLQPDGTSVSFTSVPSTGLPDPAQFTLHSGADNEPSDDASAPYASLLDVHGDSAVDLLLSGNVIKTDNSGNETGWQVPSFMTTWTAVSTFGSLTGLQPLHYRLDIEDNLVLEGCFNAGATPGTAVIQLPSRYRPKVGKPIPMNKVNGAGSIPGWMYVSAAGNLNVNTQLGSVATANIDYCVDAVIPLGNIN